MPGPRFRYATFQARSGFIAHRARGDAEELCEELADMEKQFDTVFGKEISFARAALHDAERRGVLRDIQRMTREAIQAGRKEKEGGEEADVLHIYADGDGGVEVGEEDARQPLDSDVMAGDDASDEDEDEDDAEGGAEGDGEAAAAAAAATAAAAAEAEAAAAAASLAEAAEAAAEAAADAGGHLQEAFASATPITAAIALRAIRLDMRAYLHAMESYLVRRVAASYDSFPLRIASYWHPTKGAKYLKEDYDKYMPLKLQDLVGRCKLSPCFACAWFQFLKLQCDEALSNLLSISTCVAINRAPTPTPRRGCLDSGTTRIWRRRSATR